jgi:hypothetical protein
VGQTRHLLQTFVQKHWAKKTYVVFISHRTQRIKKHSSTSLRDLLQSLEFENTMGGLIGTATLIEDFIGYNSKRGNAISDIFLI